MRPCLLLVLVVLPWCTATVSAEEVLIYRCVAGDGGLTLRDSPCEAGERQDLRSMVRPRDPPPRPDAPATAPSPEPAQPASREVQVVYRTPPRPMYECRTQDGDTYVSDNGEGNPRWVPLWTLGYPTWTGRHAARANPSPARPRVAGAPPTGGPHPPRPVRPRPGGPPVHAVAHAGGTWIRDRCHPLPQQEICSRLGDRRWEILRRYNSADQTERRELDLEKRGIDARVDNDCGATR